TCDVPRSGRPIEAATPEVIDKVHDIVLTDRRVKVRELVEATGISHGTVISILQEQLDEFLRRFIIVNETWIHYFTPETKEQSKPWTSTSEPAPKKTKTVKSAGKVMIGDYYAALLDHFNNILKKKCSHLAKKKVLFHQDNARIHTCPAPMAKRMRLSILKHLGGKKFTSNEEVIAETEAYFAEFDKSYFSERLKKWQKRWEKCVLLKGDYVEKKKKFL
ncbi:SETMR methyltransferase, partial [Acromyrmex charruanus]